MILALFVVLGLVAGLLAKGSFSNMGKHKVVALWVPIAAFLLKAAFPYLLDVWPHSREMLQLAAAAVQYTALLAFAGLNWRWRWWPLVFGLGTAMNAAVILLNGGAMPVSQRLLTDVSPQLAQSLMAGEIFGYTLQTEATRLPALGDILYIGFGRVQLGLASIGDFFIGLGGALFAFGLMRPPAKKEKAAAQGSPRSADMETAGSEKP